MLLIFQLATNMMLKVVLLLAFLADLAISCKDNAEIPGKIGEGVERLKRTGNVPDCLVESVKELLAIKDDANRDAAFCATCNNVVSSLIAYRRAGSDKDTMVGLLRNVCYAVTDWGRAVCDGYIDIEIDTALYIVDNRRNLTSQRVCAIVFQDKGCQDPDVDRWSVEIQRQNPINNITKNVEAGETFKILHLTDFHYDPLYKEGTDADCGVPMCCQGGVPTDPSTAAGFWGDYHVCDTPWRTIIDITSHLNRKPDQFDYIYYTGDIISHKSWMTSRAGNTAAIRKIFALFQDNFKVPVYPILGNHEPHPTNFYSPGNFSGNLSTQWVFDLMADEWARWLPEQTKSTIRIGGYYTVLIRPGFRIVALNSNVCYTSNYWVVYDDRDPFGQLQWLVQILAEAEGHGETVHILSHVPPGDATCSKQWAHEFRRIVNRFAGTISAQFNGHTHLDELRVFHDLHNTSRVVNVAFNAGSFTTFVGFNPNYRIYDIDANNFAVTNYNHFTFNLTKANLDRSDPEWYQLYSFKDAYSMPDLSLDSFGGLVQRMSKNPDLIRQYYRFQVRESDAAMAMGCDQKCLVQIFCTITAVEFDDVAKCLEFKRQYSN